MMRRGNRVDSNHAQIKGVIEDIPGVEVHDMSAAGNGVPDLCCFWRGQTVWIECKDGDKPPSKRRLTDAQEIFHASANAAGVTIHVCKNEQEALAVFGVQI